MGNDVRMLLVVPSDPLKPRRPDEHFADEYEAAADLGIDVALVDHDALVAGNASEGVVGVAANPDVVYRGWMVSSQQYAAFETSLIARGAALRTPADMYRSAHELPGWIGAVNGLTAETLWTETDSLDELDAACQRLGSGSAVLRDYVKSAKHYWDEAVFIPDVTDLTTARAVATRLRELRDDDFTGGFVLRRFEEYVSAEVRTWWIDGRCALTTAHPDTPESAPSEYTPPPALAETIAGLGLRFVTADLARRTDGAWRVIEIGDGQVSDRPRTAHPAALLTALKNCDDAEH